MSESVGAIYYTVEADTAKLVGSASSVDTLLDRLNQRFGQTDKAAAGAEMRMTKTAAAVRGLGRETDAAAAQMGRLVKLMGGLIAVQGVGGLIEMAESYGEMAERIQMATASQDEYEKVQQRLMATANGTYRALSEAQEVYILTADSLRSMGYSTDQALDITDSLSYAFVKNAASAERGANATRAYSNAIMKGKVEADGWSTIVSAVPSIIQDIANASGMSAEEIRKMGAEGKLTAEMLNEGLRQSLESNKKAADDMATTVRDAFTNLRTNLSAFIGEANRSTGATGVLASAIEVLGNNIDVVVKLLGVAGAGAMATYVARLGAMVVEKGRAVIAARAQAAEELRLAQAHAATTRAALAHAQANVGLAGGHGNAARAATTHTAALARLQAAQAAAAGAGRTLLGMLGGPVGIIAMLAVGATSFVDFGGRAKEAATDLDELAESIKRLTAAEVENQQIKLERSIEELERQVKSLSTELAHNEKTFEELAASGNHTEEELRNFREVVSDIRVELQKKEGRLARAIELQGQLADRASDLASETEEAAAAQRALNDAMRGFSGATGDYLKRMQERTAAMQDGNSAVKQAERYLAGLTDVSDAYRAAVMSQAHAQDAMREALERERKSRRSSTDTAKRQADQEGENKKVIDGLAQALYEAGLAGEALAVAKVRASMNVFATPQEVAQAEALARAIYQVGEAEKQRQLLRSLDPFANEAHRFETEMENLRKLNEAKLMEDQRYLDLKAQAEAAHEDNMRRLQEENFRRQSTMNDILIGTLNHLEQASASAITGIISGASNGRDAVIALGQAITQEVVGALVAMGIQWVKSVVMGQTQQVAAAAATAATAGTIAAAWAPAAAFASLASFGANAAPASAGIATTVGMAKALSVVGGRQYGGPVDAGKMYRVNETGAPEILNTASGRQFLLPNQRGQVISNKDAAKGGANVIVNVINNTNSRVETHRRQGDEEREQIIEVVIESIANDGPMADAIEGKWGLAPRGR